MTLPLLGLAELPAGLGQRGVEAVRCVLDVKHHGPNKV